MDIRTKLKEAIGDGFDHLKGVDKSSDEYVKNAKVLMEFMDRDINIEKIEIERKTTSEAQRNELSLKAKQMREEKIDRYVRNGLMVISVVGEIVLIVWGTNKTLKFEEFGTVTSTAGRKFTSKLFFWKK